MALDSGVILLEGPGVDWVIRNADGYLEFKRHDTGAVLFRVDASGGAIAAYGTGAFGFDSDAHASELHAMVVKLHAALVANGIMS